MNSRGILRSGAGERKKIMKGPEVSIIIPVYNVEEYLPQCLQSLLSQSMSDIEVICIDDGSTDGSLRILQNYAAKDDRIRVYTQENMGAGAARNIGMQYACGRFMYFMDADDYCHPNFLETATQEATKKKTDILVFDFYRYNNVDGSLELRKGLSLARYPREKEIFSYKDVPQDICRLVNPTPWNKLYTTEFVRKIGQKWLETSTTNDITYATISVLMAERIGYLEEAFLYYRVALNNSITSRKKYCQDNVIQAVLELNERAELLPYYAEVKNSVREFVADNLLNALKSYTSDEDTSYHLVFRRKIESIFFSHALFRDMEANDYKDEKLYSQVVVFRNRALLREDFRYAPRLIVSLTSFPARIGTVYKAIASIYRQTLQPYKVILWLAESQFPKKEAELPVDLLEYRQLGFEIRWCPEDIRPHKKYYYAMQEYPEDLIVTIDDDLTYDPYMLETLFASYLHFPKAVSSVRAHLIVPDKTTGAIAPYNDWIKEFSGAVGVPSMQLFSTSGAGTLYPPHCMDDEVFSLENIKELSLNADDLWLKIMQVRKGTPVVLVQKNNLLRYIPDTQQEALRDTNVTQNANDVQLRNILTAYDRDGSIVKKIFMDGYTKTTVIRGFDVFSENKFGLLSSSEKEAAVSCDLEKVERELRAIKGSVAYIVGSAITLVPRKVVGGIRCLKENGMKYTIVHTFEKMAKIVRKAVKIIKKTGNKK